MGNIHFHITRFKRLSSDTFCQSHDPDLANSVILMLYKYNIELNITDNIIQVLPVSYCG